MLPRGTACILYPMTTTIAGAPVAAVKLPRGVPSGFHESLIAEPS